MSAPGFWDDVENANKVNQKVKQIDNKLGKYERLMAQAEDMETLMELTEEADDESMLPEVESEYQSLSAAVEELRLQTLQAPARSPEA